MKSQINQKVDQLDSLKKKFENVEKFLNEKILKLEEALKKEKNSNQEIQRCNSHLDLQNQMSILKN